MKIALIITGQLRTYKLCGNVLKNTIIDKYDTDVFLSINKSNNLQNENLNSKIDSNNDDINEAIQYFNPKCVFVSNGYDDIFENLEVNKTLKENRLILEQYYIVQQGYKLLIKYSKTNNIYYDAIIRVRFDQFIWSDSANILSKILIGTNNYNDQIRIIYNEENIKLANDNSKDLKMDIDIPNTNEIFVFGGGVINSNYSWVNEQFWVHSMDLIDTMYTFYDNIPNIIDEVLSNDLSIHNCPYMELIFSTFLNKNNIQIIKSKIHGQFCYEY